MVKKVYCFLDSFNNNLSTWERLYIFEKEMKKHLYKTKEKKSLQSAHSFYSDHFLKSESVDENKVNLSLLNYTKRNGECKSHELAIAKKENKEMFYILKIFKEI